MTTKEQLIEQHIREYESRLKHIDELFERAHEAAGQPEDTSRSAAEYDSFFGIGAKGKCKGYHQNCNKNGKKFVFHESLSLNS